MKHKSKIERLHKRSFVMDEMIKQASRINKQINQPHKVRWGKGA